MHLTATRKSTSLFVSGFYRSADEHEVFDISSGASITIPEGACHSWRNLSSEPSHLLVILAPCGFEQCIQTIHNNALELLEAVPASFGCYIVGPAVGA
jgi:mannose-6-phosphate isomerase-like protein (cupin superfamily)